MKSGDCGLFLKTSCPGLAWHSQEALAAPLGHISIASVTALARWLLLSHVRVTRTRALRCLDGPPGNRDGYSGTSGQGASVDTLWAEGDPVLGGGGGGGCWESPWWWSEWPGTNSGVAHPWDVAAHSFRSRRLRVAGTADGETEDGETVEKGVSVLPLNFSILFLRLARVVSGCSSFIATLL